MLPGVGLVVMGRRVHVQIKQQSLIKLKPEGTGYQATVSTELGPFSTQGIDARRIAPHGDGWQGWRIYSGDALQSFLAALFPGVRRYALRASTSQRLRALLEGTRSSSVADVSQWEFWDGLNNYLQQFPPVGEESGGSARIARRIANLIAKGGAVHESDLAAGSHIAEVAMRRGFEPPLVESTSTPPDLQVEVFDTVETHVPLPATRRATEDSQRGRCIHGYPSGICNICGTSRMRRRRGP